MDVERFKTIEGRVERTIKIERSEFIATLSYAETDEDARTFISEISKKYKDATHNCPAYRILTVNGIVEFSSDAGEPSGTAGVPMLNVLRREGLLNVAVVVTRYFGGVKLGIRGLIEAYSRSVEEVVRYAKELGQIIVKKRAYKQKLKIDFPSYGKKMQQLAYMGVNILDISYDEHYAYVEVLTESSLDLPEVIETAEVYVRE
ncbi:IMPACT family protein [Fervidobacterium thailandense]|uniref:Impact N-terminal domain-containing protein n=1 Tax=Fervidobacterium thailandense TaxID=1008305 RepID=A0A1E3G0Z5_9BACT|nr:YigZ family protein [Fervidobacterium thailandense]ODN29892.1 hypothetical protein A4H02_08140 [Fervidobacterium thailandense]